MSGRSGPSAGANGPVAVRIRPAAAEDLAAVADFASEVDSAAWSLTAFEEQLAHSGGAVWVAEDRVAPGLVGYLAGRVVVDELHIEQVAVAPAQRRRGIARALIRAALEGHGSEGAGLRAAEGRLEIAHLELRASNDAARSLYASLGFVVVGRRPRYYPAGEDAVLMTWRRAR